MNQSRWRSVVLWGAIAAQVISLLQLLGVFKKFGFDAGYAGTIGATVLQLLVTTGILINPQDSTGDFFKKLHIKKKKD
jgi:uncharacterized membrane protein